MAGASAKNAEKSLSSWRSWRGSKTWPTAISGFGGEPELFPAGFDRGFRTQNPYRSPKLGATLRQVQLRNGRRDLVRHSFAMPYLSGHLADVGHGLSLRKFGVPPWALARMSGRDPMCWFRPECRLGRASVVGATVGQAKVPSRPVGRRAPPGPRTHSTPLTG